MNSSDFVKLFGLIILFCGYSSAELVEANWRPCKLENGNVIPVAARDIKIYITNCTKDESVCRLVRGTTPLLNITFTPTVNSAQIERGLIAKIYMSALGKYVNIPYGNLWDPCVNMINLNTSATNCQSTGILKDNVYNSVSEFKVNEDFPQVSDITVRVILRQKHSNRRVSSLRKWDRHPGPLFACIEVPNCAVV